MTKNEKQTSMNRINAIDDLEKIIRIADGQIVRSKNIPLLDSDEHADLIQGYADRIHEILMDMRDLANMGRQHL